MINLRMQFLIVSVLISGFIFSDAPDWSVNPPSFEFSGSVSAAVFLNDELVGSESDMLAGFVDDELRGVVTGLVFPPTGNFVFSLLLYSNQVSGETITFKFYHADSDQVFDLNETLDFESDMIIGNAFATYNFCLCNI